jgi:hypothetical protein
VNFRNSSQRQSGFSNNQAGLNSRGADPKYMFVGLCQVNENHSMEDTHKSQNSMLLNLLDSNFWSNGNQIQNFYGGTKNIKIKNPFEQQREKKKPSEDEIVESDIIRIAIDLRFAQNFQSFWNEEE